MNATARAVDAGVRNTIGAHTQAQDAGRTDDVVALYAADAVLELPGADPIIGHAALREAFTGWAPTAPQLHIVTNTAVTPGDATTATARSDVAFTMRGDAGWGVLIVGHYDDQFTLQDGSWVITSRATTYIN